jgi:TetR/AcrR family transcriptional regulator
VPSPAQDPADTRRSTTSGRPRPRRAPAPDERQQDADRTRQRLLDAALEVFAAKGFAGARVQEIADRAGVNKQLINYYFDSKEGLYRELQHTWLRRERTFADPDLPLDELAAWYLHEALTEPRLTRLMAWRGLLDGDDPSPPDDPGHGLGDLSTMQARQANGQLAADLDPASVRLAIMGAVMVPVVMPQLVRQIFGLDPTAPEFEARYGEHLRAIIRRLSPACATPPSPTGRLP